VKHDLAAVTRLRTLASLVGCEMSQEQAEYLVSYLACVLRENERVNLTAMRDPETALRLHVVDSVSALPEVSSAPPGPLLDLGTGAGFPGVPLGVVSGRETTLLDSVKKKIAAVERCLASNELLPGFSAVGERSEEYARRGYHYAAVVARAVAPLGSLVELAAPLLQDGGAFIAMKGALEPDEVSRGDRAAALVGLRRTSIRRLVLPEGGESRTLVTYERDSEPGLRLPRRPGLATSEPLG